MNRSIQAEAQIDNTPEAVIGYIADVRNRPLYLPILKSVDDIQGEPTSAGTTWKWTIAVLGMEFEGTGRATAYEPGRLYSFETEGNIQSTWTYRAASEGEGTRLSVEVQYEVPERAIPFLPTDTVADSMRKAEADRAVQNLKQILDR